MNELLTAALVSASLVGLTLAGCSSEPADPVDRAVAIAREIQADPASAEEVLEDHEITIEEFEELVYEIAADPELSARYQSGLAGEN